MPDPIKEKTRDGSRPCGSSEKQLLNQGNADCSTQPRARLVSPGEILEKAWLEVESNGDPDFEMRAKCLANVWLEDRSGRIRLTMLNDREIMRHINMARNLHLLEVAARLCPPAPDLRVIDGGRE